MVVDDPAAAASRRRISDHAASERLLVTGMRMHFPASAISLGMAAAGRLTVSCRSLGRTFSEAARGSFGSGPSLARVLTICLPRLDEFSHNTLRCRARAFAKCLELNALISPHGLRSALNPSSLSPHFNLDG